MGFGPGILAPASRGPVVLAAPPSAPVALAPMGLLTRRSPALALAHVIVPDGTPPFWRNPPFNHEVPGLLVTLGPDGEPLRTPTSDARDLLVDTLFQRTAVRDTFDRPTLGPTPVLDAFTESEFTATFPAVFPEGFFGVPLSPVERKFIHVGPTRAATRLLGELNSLGLLDPNFGWDGDPAHLDTDGYVMISLRQGSDLHLLLVGGGEYGTYYAVVRFLYQYAGARWLLPGEIGTVIPEADTFDLPEVVNLIDAPDYRGRSLEAMVPSAQAFVTNEEINDTRNWLLRSRLRPSTERSVLFYLTNPAARERLFCESLPFEQQGFLASEVRIPTGHNLSRFLSPNDITMDPSQYPIRTSSANRSEVMRDIFPHVASCDRSTRGNYGDRLAETGSRDFCRREDLACVAASACGCVPVGSCACAYEQPLFSSTTPTKLAPVMSDPREPTCLAMREQTRTAMERFAGALPGSVAEDGTLLRYIPRTYTVTHYGSSYPVDDKWAPCLYVSVPPRPSGSPSPYPRGRLAAFRTTVARDITARLANMFSVRNLFLPRWESEFCESLAFNDSLADLWCECVPCRLSDTLDGPNRLSIVFRGHVILPDYQRLGPPENPEAGPAPARGPWFTEDPTLLLARERIYFLILAEAARGLRSGQPIDVDLVQDLGLNRVEFTHEEATRLTETWPANLEDSTQWTDSIDAAALQGLINDRARLNVYTRRVIDLMNEVGRALDSPDVAWPIDPAQALVTFHAYWDYTAPPVFARDPLRRSFRVIYGEWGEVREIRQGLAHYYFHHDRGVEAPLEAPDDAVLHPSLTPILATSCDLWEYRDEAEPLPARAHVLLRKAPDQLNLRRWGLIARQTGLYEYFWGMSFIAPRIYTRRLSNAIRRAHRDAHARVFVGECVPNMGMDAIKYYEAAQALWDVQTNPDETRHEFCEALYGRGSYVAKQMALYFHALETLWVRGSQEQRYFPLDFIGFTGLGIAGRCGWITQLDGFMRTSADVAARTVPRFEEMPFQTAWAHLQNAYVNTVPGVIRDRVQYFRRAFGLVRELIRVYQHVLRVWAIVEPFVPFGAEEPLVWARTASVPPAQRDLVRNELDSLSDPGGLAWNTSLGFRSNMREPIHRYMMESNFATDVGTPDATDQLGLGLGSYVGGRFATNYRGPDAARHAIWLPLMDEYFSWWNQYGIIEQRVSATEEESILLQYPTTSEDHFPSNLYVSDGGIGNTMFWSMKRLVAALMYIGTAPVRDSIRFMGNA